MHFSFAPFPNSIAITYMCPPEIFALNRARSGIPVPVDIPNRNLAMRVWVELPAFEVSERERWVERAAAWVIENCHEIEHEIRCSLIRPMFLN